MDSTVDSTGTRLGLDWDSTVSVHSWQRSRHRRRPCCHASSFMSLSLRSHPELATSALFCLCPPRETALWQHVSFFGMPVHREADPSAIRATSTVKRACAIKKQTSLVLSIIAWRVYHQLWLYRRMCHASCGTQCAIRSPCCVRANLLVTCGRPAVSLLWGDTQHLVWGTVDGQYYAPLC